ncbi:hypothetical protein KR032_012218 [Drosophila birchii]|nr:hypothetical protein KR032_012218 [Drosophila birchii]
MTKLGVVCLLVASLCAALAWAEPRQQGLQGRRQLQQQHPYIFLTIPQGRANAGSVVQGFEIVEELDESDLDHQRDDIQNDENDVEQDDDDEDEEEELEHQLGLNFARSGLAYRRQELEEDDAEQDDDQEQQQQQQQQQQVLPKKTQMMVARDQAGAIMVPDGIIEIEGQSVLDEKTGKAALLVPRAALDAIPDGAVVALMERSASSGDSDEIEEERANRVVVRRRKNNGRRNIRRRGTNARRRRRPVQRRRRGGNRGGNRRRNVRVIRPGGNRRRGGNQRRRGQVVLQG